MKQGLKICVAVVISYCLLTAPVWAEKPETQIPATLEGELKYLLGFVGPGHAPPSEFARDRIAGLIGFLDSAKDAGRLYRADSPKGMASAYYEIDIRRGLNHLLRLTYGEVPEVFTAPSTLRRAEWTRIDGGLRHLPRLWEMDANSAPIAFAGVEHLVNTPDQTTGAYYDYDLHRTVFLAAVDGRRLLVSLSRQAGISGVGRQGLVVGPDDRWDYLYSGETGLSRFGIGWAKTYMFDSYSVAFYRESASGSQVRFGVFKWLGAGWNGINMVKPAHIHAGLVRYGATFRQIAEHPRVADLPALEKDLAAIRSLPDARVRSMAAVYVSQLGQQACRRGLLSEEEVRSRFDVEATVKASGRGDLETILLSEYLKQSMGKPHVVNVREALKGR